MEILLFLMGLGLVGANKFFGLGFAAWSRDVWKFSDPGPIWFYRILCIVIGLIFISVYIFKTK